MLNLLRQVLTMMLVSLLLPGLWLWVAFSNADRFTNGILSERCLDDYLILPWPRVVRLSDRVQVEWFRQIDPISDAGEGVFPVSGIGLVDAARITPVDGVQP